MALTGRTVVQATAENNLIFYWEAAQSVSDNRSVVTWQLQLQALDNGKIVATPGSPWEVTVDGKSFSGTSSLAVENGQTKVLASGSVTLEHAADGSRSFSYSFTQKFYITFDNAYITQVSGSGSAQLDTIPRASQPSVSASTVDLGTKLTVYTNRKSNAFTHTLSYQFGSASGIIAQDVGDSCQWTPPLSLAAQLPNEVSGTAILTCTTYAGGTPIGSKQTTVVLTVPASVVPTASAQWSDASGADAKLETLVQNVSRLRVEVTGTGIYGSSVVGSSVTLEGKPYSGGTVTASGDLTLAVSVTDSRGRTGTESYPITVAPYSAPELSVSASRCLADGTPDDTGDCAKITVSGFVTQVNGKNTADLTLTYGTATEQVSLAPGDIAYQTEPFYADPDATMPISAELADALCTATRSMTLSTGYATVDFLKGGKGVSVGKAATKEGFECAMPAYFTGGINGAYLLTCYVSGINKLRLQTKYTDFSGTGDNRQSIFLFGSANFSPVHGLLTVNNAGRLSWSGTGTVIGAAGEDGIVELTLPTTCWDWFLLLSAEHIAAV